MSIHSLYINHEIITSVEPEPSQGYDYIYFGLNNKELH